MLTEPAPSWNPLRDLQQILEYHFMINALLAGSAAAVMAALVGMDDGAAARDLRGPHARDDGVSGRSGRGARRGARRARLPASSAEEAPPRSRARRGRGGSWREEAAGVGVVQAMALGLGFLFVSLYGGVLGDLESLLFGDVLGVSDAQVLLLAAVALAVLGVLAAIGRPLLLSSIDPPLASARGVPVRGSRWRSSRCSPSPSPRRARSPGPCSCSRCW